MIQWKTLEIRGIIVFKFIEEFFKGIFNPFFICFEYLSTPFSEIFIMGYALLLEVDLFETHCEYIVL